MKTNKPKPHTMLIAALACLAVILMGHVPASAQEGCGPANPLACRPYPPPEPKTLAAAPLSPAPGYCSSSGGSTLYENISSVSVVQNQDKLTITVNVYIANPTGCSAGNPCPEYDSSPEYVNVWIDYDGDGTWESQERVMDEAGTGYLNLNYHGTMTFTRTVTIPAGAVENTWLRANLGWGEDPNDPCLSSWTWGNAVDQAVQISTKTPEIEDIEITPTNPETTKDVTFNAKLKNMTGYDIVKITWAGDLPSGNSKPGTTDYTVKPKPGIHGGNKNMTATLTYRKTGGGSTATTSKSKKFNLFFVKDGDDSAPFGQPNWFDYWNQLNVGDRHGMTDVRYDGAMTGADGQYTWSTTFVRIGPGAAGVDYKPPGTKIIGIDNFAQSLTHECLHYHHWDSWFRGQNPPDGDQDELPNWYEDVGNDGQPNTGDAHELDGVFNGAETYDVTQERTAGNPWADDEEWVTHKETDSNRGPWKQDWASPGKQTTPKEGETSTSSPITTLAPLISTETEDEPKWIPLAAPPAHVFGIPSDRGIDINSDDLFEYMAIDFTVEAIVGATYTITAGLEDSAGNKTWSALTTNLPLGTTVVALRFPGSILRMHRVNGPFEVVLLNIFDQTNALVDFHETFHTTLPYAYTNFAPAGSEIVGPISESLVDNNANGLADVLELSVPVDIPHAGHFILDGFVQAPDGTVLAYVKAEQDLAEGVRPLDLIVNGNAIRQSRANGPYMLKSLSLFEDTNRVDFIYEACQTAAYAYTNFEGGEAAFASATTFTEQGVDSNGDGMFDWLRINMSAQISAAGQYAIVARLFDTNGNSIDDVLLTTNVDVGQKTFALDFSGTKIRQHGVPGPYVVRYAFLYGTDGSLADALKDAYTTQPYQLWQFQMLLAGLTGTFSDQGIDNNGNGLFDLLRVNVGVNAMQPGNVVVEARLQSVDGMELGHTNSFVALPSAGQGTVQLNFDGKAIFASGKNGPYILADVRAYHTGDPSQSEIIPNAYTTGIYAATNFEPTAVIRGTVRQSNGTPIGGAVVSAGGKSVYSSSDGQYYIGLGQAGAVVVGADPPAGLPDGPWQFFVDGGLVSTGQTATVTVPSDTAIQVDIVLSGNRAPTADAGPDQTVECAGGTTAVQLDGTGSSDPDNDPLAFQWWLGGALLGTNPVETVSLPLGQHVIVLRVGDPSGAESWDTNIVTVVDTTPPVITCASNKVVECGAAWDFDEPTATDNCAGTNVTLSIVSTVTNAGCGGTFTVTRTWQAVDSANNTATCSQTVTVVDTTPPTIACPAPIAAEFQDETGVVVTFVVTASDGCSPVSLAVAPASGSLFPIGVTPVQAVALDDCGNSNQCAFTVTVLGAQGVKSNVLGELIELHSASTNEVDKAGLCLATEQLTAALRTNLWVDQTHIVSRQGGVVFSRENVVVGVLLGLKYSSRSAIPDEVLQSLIDRIVKADRLLAVVSIQDAAHNGVKPKRILLARKWLEIGDGWAGKGFPMLAIMSYHVAWRFAEPLCIESARKCDDGKVTLEFFGVPGDMYVVEASTNLIDWVSVGTATADENGNVSFSDPQAEEHAARFYRVLEQ